MLGKAKVKVAEIISDVLIFQAEQGVKFSPIPLVSEAKFPVELMKDDAS